MFAASLHSTQLFRALDPLHRPSLMLPTLSALLLAAAPQAASPVGTLQRIDVPNARTPGPVSIDLQLGDRDVVLKLERYSVRSSDFTLWVTAPNGTAVEMPAPVPQTWRGEVLGMPDAHVSASITNEGLSALVVDVALDEEWQIQPALGQPAGVYSVAQSADLPPVQGVCGVHAGSLGPIAPASGDGTGNQLCEIAVDADYEFYQRNGNSVAATLNDMERVLNSVGVIYERDCDVAFQVTAAVVRTNVADPYTSSDAQTLLNQFAFQWNSNFNGVRRDVAHLFTGRVMQTNTIGIAYTGAICSSMVGYGLSESRFSNFLINRTGLTAHEIGHNFNALHCNGNGDCRIMCAGLGGCNNNVTSFGAVSRSVIRNYAIGRPCLLDLAPPVAVPFIEEVPTTFIDSDLWISNQGVLVSSAAINEPSPTLSFQFNAQNAGLEFDDRLISNKLLLGGQSGFEVQFESQARGVSNGNAIRVDVTNVNGQWFEVGRVVSSGTTQNTFETQAFPLPQVAYHNEAQLRIVAEVDGPTETWYIDDFRVTDQPLCGAIDIICVQSPNSVSPAGASLSTSGSTSVAANDLTIFANALPSNQFGLLVYGDQQQFIPLGDGFLCVNGSPIYRLGVQQASLFGIAEFPIDLGGLPPGSSILPGEIVNFQVWYRDTTPAGFNLSTGLAIEFCQ